MSIDTKEQRTAAKAEAAAAKARAKSLRPWYRKKRFIIPLLFVLLIVIISVASGGGDETSSGGADGSAASQETQGERTYSVGETSQTDDFEMTVHEVRDPYTSTNQFDTPDAGNRYVAVEVEVKNVGDDRQTISTLLGAELIDSLNRPWDIALAGMDLPQLDGEVVPGQSRRGWMVFEVPADASGLKLRLKGSITAQGSLYVL